MPSKKTHKSSGRVLARPEAQQLIAVLQEEARFHPPGVTYRLSDGRILDCVWAPNMSYGRYHAPVPECEAFEYHWRVWMREWAHDDDRGFVKAGAVGWRTVLEPEALALLTGTEAEDRLAQGRELARRFS